METTCCILKHAHIKVGGKPWKPTLIYRLQATVNDIPNNFPSTMLELKIMKTA